MKLSIYPEICCDYCNDVIHNHFDCPACGKEYARTDCYGEIWEKEVIACADCRARFKLVSTNGCEYLTDEWEWERI